MILISHPYSVKAIRKPKIQKIVDILLNWVVRCDDDRLKFKIDALNALPVAPLPSVLCLLQMNDTVILTQIPVHMVPFLLFWILDILFSVSGISANAQIGSRNLDSFG